MPRLGQFCLTSQIVLAPLLLGGGRPWAMAVLTILTGIGLIITGWRSRAELTPGIRHIIIAGALVSLWLVLQAIPIWPIQPLPFDAPRIALYPHALQSMVGNIVWLVGTCILAAQNARSQSRAFIRHIAIAVVVSASIQAVLAAFADVMAIETTYWFSKQAHLGDWTGTFANRNAFGGLMAIAILCCLYLFCRKSATTTGQRIDHAGGWIALALIFTVALIESHSRSAVVALAIAVASFAILYRPAHFQTGIWRAAYPILTIISMLAILTLVAAMVPDLGNRFAELARLDLIQRDEAWQTAFIAISHRPLVGFGPDAITLVMDHFATTGLNRNAAWFSSHNLWLDAALAFGIPATILIVGFILHRLIRAIRNTGNRADRTLLITLAILSGIMASLGWVASLPALILPFLSVLSGLEAAPKAQGCEVSQYLDGYPRSEPRLPAPALSPRD
ncbi:O-antigen ligase family protein [Thalassospira lucentensis]|uniref:O-antigen ligase family protein n=1 Tax=Thalassospira lucentensis TaxID=168935 RepID=UPI00294364BC|nr:O-antigen ligase family protein [Thalassospira lucentensis]WOI09445.1 O-antigen ligase family protein [Thalassospira lucentensis]